MRPEINTDRLHLRPFRLEDAPVVSRLAGDPDIARMTSTVPSPYPVEVAEAWIFLQTLKNKRAVHHPRAVTRADGALVGSCGVFKRSAAEPDYEIGFWIGRPYWGAGYATEAARGLIDAARADLGADCITAGYFEDNDASARVQAKLGFKPTGARRELFSLARSAKAWVVEMALAPETAHSGAEKELS